METTPFACNMNALSKEERTRHGELTRALFAAVAERAELESSYAFRLAASDLPIVAEWIGFESRCCPFFDFELDLARDRGPLWLRIRGADGVKAFLRAELDLR
jgi:hypothetical protein